MKASSPPMGARCISDSATDTGARRRAAFAALLLLATALIWTAIARGWTAGVDSALLVAMAGGPAALWHGVTVTGDTVTRVGIAVMVAAWLVWRGRRCDALWLVAAVGGGIALNEGAKALFHRARPGLLPHLDDVGVLSFPSGHSAGAMVLGLTLALIAGGGRWVWIALSYAVLVGCSRLALAVHWPSDVAAGWCLGAAWALALSVFAQRWRPARHR